MYKFIVLVSILVLVLLFSVGCILENIQDHIRLIRTDADFFSIGIVFELDENPVGNLPK